MDRRVIFYTTLLIVILLLLWLVLAPPGQSQGQATVSGFVYRSDGSPAAGAWVRVQTTNNLVYAAVDGSFTLQGLAEGIPVTVTAWYPQHKVGWAAVTPPTASVAITVRPYDTGDNTAYAWNTSYADPANPTLGCGHCMAPSFDEWQHTAHAASGTNPRFFSLYNGTNLAGDREVAPGYRQDFPGTAGSCAACHAPGAAYDAPFTTDMNALSGVNREGVFCEFCHKVGAVYLDPATNLPYENAPGVLSMRLYRPFGSDQIFFGSLDDVTRRVSYLPVERKSQFCAPCHQFSFWGTPIYESYREWLESPYPAQGVECQTCHMPPGASTTFVLPEKGGLSRDPQRMASHLDLGVKDTAFMQSTVAMTLTMTQQVDRLLVGVTLKNVGAGHHVPTDHPGRHLILVVSATDGAGNPLVLQNGEAVPAWGGAQAGLPGKAYAKVLRDVQTGAAPVISYWKQALIVSDNRLPALGSDASTYSFAAPASGGPVQVRAVLIFRRTFQALMEAKEWDSADIRMVEQDQSIDTHAWQRVYLPLALSARP